MASNGNEDPNFHQGNAAAGFHGYPQYYPGYGAAYMNQFSQWPGYGYPYPPQYHMPPMPHLQGMAPGFYTPPPGPHTPPIQ